MENVATFPRLNEAAPAFNAETTHGERSLADSKGKWLILFSHLADFRPVCTTEFIDFQKHAETFRAMNCELLDLSIDRGTWTAPQKTQPAQTNAYCRPGGAGCQRAIISASS